MVGPRELGQLFSKAELSELIAPKIREAGDDAECAVRKLIGEVDTRSEQRSRSLEEFDKVIKVLEEEFVGRKLNTLNMFETSLEGDNGGLFLNCLIKGHLFGLSIIVSNLFGFFRCVY